MYVLFRFVLGCPWRRVWRTLSTRYECSSPDWVCVCIYILITTTRFKTNGRKRDDQSKKEKRPKKSTSIWFAFKLINNGQMISLLFNILQFFKCIVHSWLSGLITNDLYSKWRKFIQYIDDWLFILWMAIYPEWAYFSRSFWIYFRNKRACTIQCETNLRVNHKNHDAKTFKINFIFTPSEKVFYINHYEKKNSELFFILIKKKEKKNERTMFCQVQSWFRIAV